MYWIFQHNSLIFAECVTNVCLVLHRPLSRRLDRCDRVIQDEVGDPNGGNMCSCSGATCTSRDVTMQITFLTRKSALIYGRDLRQRVASLTLNCNGVFAIRAYTVASSLSDRSKCFTLHIHKFGFTGKHSAMQQLLGEVFTRESPAFLHIMLAVCCLPTLLCRGSLAQFYDHCN